MRALERCLVLVFTSLAYPIQLLWGVVAGILRIVPYVGTLVAATLPIALSLAVFDGWLKPLLVFLLVAGLELIIANFVEPWLYGAHVGISSLALLVTAVFWAVLWGPAGLILSTPLTVCVVVLGRYVPATLLSCTSCWEMNLFSRPKPRSTSGCSPWINWKRRPLSASF